jgi:hypothetical protein
LLRHTTQYNKAQTHRLQHIRGEQLLKSLVGQIYAELLESRDKSELNLASLEKVAANVIFNTMASQKTAFKAALTTITDQNHIKPVDCKALKSENIQQRDGVTDSRIHFVLFLHLFHLLVNVI